MCFYVFLASKTSPRPLSVSENAPPRPPPPRDTAPPRPPPPETDDEDEMNFPIPQANQPIMVGGSECYIWASATY